MNSYYSPQKNWSQVLPESVHVVQESPWMLDGVFQFIHMGHRLSSFEIASNMHTVFVSKSDHLTYELKRGSHVKRMFIPTESLSVVAAQSRYQAFTDGSLSEDLGLLINPVRLRDLLAQDEIAGEMQEPRDGFGIIDPRISQILTMFAEDYGSKAPFGVAYREGLLGAFARHFAGTYGSLANTPGENALSRRQLRQVEEFIESHLSEDLSLTSVAEVSGYSKFHFHRMFKATMGMPLHAFILKRRVERAKELLVLSNNSLDEIALEVGFCDHGHLARHFKANIGLTPSQFRTQAKR